MGVGVFNKGNVGFGRGVPLLLWVFFFLLGGAPFRLPAPLHLLTSIYSRLHVGRASQMVQWEQDTWD